MTESRSHPAGLVLVWIALSSGCDSPGDCPPGSVFSPQFGQCVGVEEADDAPETTPTADTGDSGA